jgi:hypothetical protein
MEKSLVTVHFCYEPETEMREGERERERSQKTPDDKHLPWANSFRKMILNMEVEVLNISIKPRYS